MYDPAGHEVLIDTPWGDALARSAIEEIVADAYRRFDRTRLWPTHPLDGTGRSWTMLYFGAAGVIWALDYLWRVGATKRKDDFSDIAGELVERNRIDFTSMPYPDASSYLMGDVALLLLQWRLAPSDDVADQLFDRIRAGIKRPVLELMWGAAGTMLAALFLLSWTSEKRWTTLFLKHMDRLWGEWRREPNFGYIWTQHLYGQSCKYLGPVHGFAGNLVPLLHGQKLLGAARLQQLHVRAAETLVRTAFQDENYANWPAMLDSVHPQQPRLLQYCHGAPGMVVSLAGLPARLDPGVDRLLEKAGELIWAAGPPIKGPGLCHGTAGNGYAFLKLYIRTGDRKWLERARGFAMHAIHQCTQARRSYGQGRYSLWTGDLGVAAYLWDCISEQAEFPSIDIF